LVSFRKKRAAVLIALADLEMRTPGPTTVLVDALDAGGLEGAADDLRR
jgi:hypothetical protein